MRIHTVPSLIDRFLAEMEPSRAASAAAAFSPAVDLLETPERFELVADLPGLTSEDVEVEFADGVLHVRGERAAEAAPEGGRVYRRERRAGRFHRTVALGDDVEVEGIEASFRDGVLRIAIPKSERNRPRQIPVTAN